MTEEKKFFLALCPTTVRLWSDKKNLILVWLTTDDRLLFAALQSYSEIIYTEIRITYKYSVVFKIDRPQIIVQNISVL